MEEKENSLRTKVHPTADVHKDAILHPGVEVGPYSVIGPHVEIGEGTRIYGHVYIEGHTIIGKQNEIYPFCAIGTPPQDLSYKGEPTKVVIGDNNVIREYVSIHRATMKQDQVTLIGNNNLFMAKTHLGHDVVIEDNVRLVNSCNIAGHVHISKNVIIGGGTNIAQFIKLGRGAYIGGASGIDKDIPPFFTAYGNRIHLKGINIIGMRRTGYSREEISGMVDFARSVEAANLSMRSFIDKKDLMEEFLGNSIIDECASFVRKSDIGIAPFLS